MADSTSPSAVDVPDPLTEASGTRVAVEPGSGAESGAAVEPAVWPDEPEPTGDAGVDEVLRSLPDVRNLATAGQADAYDKLHDALRTELGAQLQHPAAAMARGAGNHP
ncbi:MAG: hypothetical protein JWO93_2331 [Micrococcaceae bacterium]|nr:hypothetical protein [Micrococcaceae bacterium]